MQSCKKNLIFHVLEEFVSDLCINVSLLNVSCYIKLMQTLSETLITSVVCSRPLKFSKKKETKVSLLVDLSLWKSYFSEIAVFFSLLANLQGSCCGGGWECWIRSLFMSSALGFGPWWEWLSISSFSYLGEEENGGEKSERNRVWLGCVVIIPESVFLPVV